MSSTIIALDVGTQSCRAAVVTAGGDLRGIAQIAHDVDSPRDGWAQQKPDGWWDEICRAIRQVVSETGTDPGSIAAVAACGQMHGPVGIDDGGAVTTERVQLWCDKRCSDQVEALLQREDADHLARIAGSAPNPAWTGLKVRWHRDNEPAVYEKSRWFLVPKDFINYRLTGVAAADPSEASGSFLWDCRAGDYSAELAEAVGVDLAKFAPVSASHEVVGEVTQQAAARTGIPAGIPVVAGGGDFPVSMLGFGIVGEDVTADVTGTSTLLAAHSPEPLVDPAMQNLRHVVDGWIPFTILDCGGMSITWCRNLAGSFAGEELSWEQLVELAAGAPPGCDGLVFFPYMLGERRRENTTARGGYFGITLNHTAAHFARAAMEAVALAMGKDIEAFRARGLAVKRIFSVGGGTRNDLLNAAKATVAGVPLEIADEPEAGLKGAALLGAAGVGLVDDPGRAAVERRRSTRTVEPDIAAQDAYAAALDEFKRIYDHLLGFWMKGRHGD